MTEPIRKCLEQWHRYAAAENGPDLPMLEDIIHDDCVFYSPVVFRPQVGGPVTRLYLTAAASSLAGDEEQKFTYTKEIASGHHAMLEFETTIDGKHVNGVDILTCDDDGKIVEFRVMVRPLQAVNAIHQSMMAMLESLKS